MGIQNTSLFYGKSVGIPLSDNPRDIQKDNILKSLADIDLSGLVIHSTATAYAKKIDKYFKYFKGELKDSKTSSIYPLINPTLRNSSLDTKILVQQLTLHAIESLTKILVDLKRYRDGLVPSQLKDDYTNIYIPEQEQAIANINVKLVNCTYTEPDTEFFVYKDFLTKKGKYLYNASGSVKLTQQFEPYNLRSIEKNIENPRNVKYTFTMDYLTGYSFELPKKQTFHCIYKIIDIEALKNTLFFVGSDTIPYLKKLENSYDKKPLNKSFSPNTVIFNNGEYPIKNTNAFLVNEELLRQLYVNIYGIEDAFKKRKEKTGNTTDLSLIHNISFQLGISLEKPSSGGSSYLFEFFSWLMTKDVITKKIYDTHIKNKEQYALINTLTFETKITTEDFTQKIEIIFDYITKETFTGTWKESSLKKRELPRIHSISACEVIIKENNKNDPILIPAIEEWYNQDFLNSFSSFGRPRNKLFGFISSSITNDSSNVKIYKQLDGMYTVITVKALKIVTTTNAHKKEQILDRRVDSKDNYNYWLTGIHPRALNGYVIPKDEKLYRSLSDRIVSSLSNTTSNSQMIIPLWDYDLYTKDGDYTVQSTFNNIEHPFRLIEQALQESLHLLVSSRIKDEEIKNFTFWGKDLIENGKDIRTINQAFLKELHPYLRFKKYENEYDEKDIDKLIFIKNIAVAPNILAFIPIPGKSDNPEETPAYFKGQDIIGKVLSNQLFMNKFTYDFELTNPLNTILTGIDYEKKLSIEEQFNEKEPT